MDSSVDQTRMVIPNDNDRSLSGNLVVRWDLDISVDSDGDGDYRMTGIESLNWDEEGGSGITVRVCDAVDVCTFRDYVITVLSTEDGYVPKSL